MSHAVIKSQDFQLIREFAQPDTKKRLSLKDAVGKEISSRTAFNIYRNELGQIILDPVKTVPTSEAWLFENAKSLASVKRGLQESAKGKRVSRGSFAKFAAD